MGLRAYLLVDIVDDMGQSEFSQALKELERIPEVDFVDPVIGSHDVVVLVEAPTTVEAVADKIRAKDWVKDMGILRIVSLFERHKASKKDLLETLEKGGV